ncbi:MAG: chorismate synthase [Treponema sp.]|nr:chorismate synthase [Treponema sp.]
MAGSSTGLIFTVSTFGESHGPAVGCVVDGCPAGLPLTREDIRRDLARRRPGGGGPSTSRMETDEPEILSGVFEGRTLGSPIAVLVRNRDAHSADYDELRHTYRPGHADWSWEAKYGLRDHRGGGRASARETVGRVAAGAVARSFLASQGISVRAWTARAAGISAPGPAEPGFDLDAAEMNPLRMPCRNAAEKALAILDSLRSQGDSAGGIVACEVQGLPPGLGEPVFGKLDARIAGAILSIGAVKGIEFGAGFAAADGRGSELNDRPLPANRDVPGLGIPAMDFASNHAGGVLGGLSTGQSLVFRAAFKPVPSISRSQETLDSDGKIRVLSIAGRHDVCVCPRAVPVVEAMTAIVLADLLLIARSNRLL